MVSKVAPPDANPDGLAERDVAGEGLDPDSEEGQVLQDLVAQRARSDNKHSRRPQDLLIPPGDPLLPVEPAVLSQHCLDRAVRRR